MIREVSTNKTFSKSRYQNTKSDPRFSYQFGFKMRPCYVIRLVWDAWIKVVFLSQSSNIFPSSHL